MERHLNIWKVVYRSECKKAQRSGWDDLQRLSGGGGLGLGLESLLGLEKAKKTKEDWLWWGEIGSEEKNNVSKDAEARSTLSWPAWNKNFCCGSQGREYQWESQAEKRA